MRRTLPVVAAALLGVSAPAQALLTVGGGGTYATIGEALDAADPGDELLVEPGSYPAFRVVEGVTIRAAVPGSVSVAPLVFNIWNVPAGQRARLVGITFANVLSISGTYAFEDCTFVGGGSAISMIQSTAHFERCTLLPAQLFFVLQGLVVVDASVVSMVDCTLNGSTAQLGSPAATVEVRNGARLVASGLTVTGGLPSNPAPALLVDASSRARITDSTLASAPNQCAIVGVDVVCERCTLSTACAAFEGEPLLGVASSGPLAPGQPYTLTFRGAPNTPVLVFGSSDLDRTPSPLLRQPFLLDGAGCFPAAAMLTGATGSVSVTWQLANVPLPVGVGLWLQGVAGTSFPLATSAAVGGVAR